MNEDDESDCITVQKPVSKAAAAAMAVAAPSPEPSFQPADTSEQTGSTTRGPPASGHCSKCHLKYRPALFRKRDPSKFGDVCAMCRFKHCVNQRTSGSGKHLPEDEKVDITEDVLDDVKRWLERMSAVHEDVSDEERRASEYNSYQ